MGATAAMTHDESRKLAADAHLYCAGEASQAAKLGNATIHQSGGPCLFCIAAAIEKAVAEERERLAVQLDACGYDCAGLCARFLRKQCSGCGRPATCFGSYELSSNPKEYACDGCCGHGNEDGHCEPVNS